MSKLDPISQLIDAVSDAHRGAESLRAALKDGGWGEIERRMAALLLQVDRARWHAERVLRQRSDVACTSED